MEFIEEVVAEIRNIAYSNFNTDFLKHDIEAFEELSHYQQKSYYEKLCYLQSVCVNGIEHGIKDLEKVEKKIFWHIDSDGW